MSWVLTLAGVNKKPFTCENQLALGDRYRKFYRTLNNAKKKRSFNIQFKKISTLFIQNFIHLKSSQNIHSKIYSFKV